MEQNVIQINGGITINVDACVKNVICVEKICLESYYMYLSNGKYLASIMDNSALCLMKFIEGTVLANFNEKKASCKTQNFCFTCIFINYNSIIDTC